jgi:trimeric autotransporter adhesin
MTKQKAMLLAVGLCAVLSFTFLMQAQQTGSPSSAATALPRLVRFNGTAKDLNANPLTGVVGITFALYSEQNGGASLWLETQNVQADANGHYTVLLGASKPDGLPIDLFTSEQARWVGVQISGQTEQARVLLVSAPYALKAGDAETVGGLPASAFALASSSPARAEGATGSLPKLAQTGASQANADVTGKGTIGYVPMWDSTSDIVDSLIFQKSSDIGIGTKTPAATLDVSGKSDIRDTLTLFPKGKDSALTINGTAFKIDQTGTVTFVPGQIFPGGGGGGTVTSVGSGAGLTGGPITKSGTLSIPTAGVTNAMLQNSTLKLTPGGGMTGGGSVALGGSTTLGLENCSANQVLEFIGSAWTCASAGMGTITGVTAGTDLTGGGTSGQVTLNLDTTKIPQLATSNGFVGTQTVQGTVQAFSINNAVTGSTDSNTGFGVFGNGPGAGVTGVSVAFSNTAVGKGNAGVWGDTGAGAGSGHAGVLGTADANTAGWFINDGPFATVLATNSYPNVTGAFGVAAESNYIGVYGVLSGASGTGVQVDTNAGVWGDTPSVDGVAVLGTADNTVAAVFVNSSDNDDTMFLENDSVTTEAIVFESRGGAGGDCSINGGGDLFCTGSKSAVVPVDGGSRKVALYAIEGPENWFEDAGSAQLLNGAAIVNLEPIFGQTVNTQTEYHVFLTPEGDCKGLYVAQKSPTSFEVRELGGGTSSIAFDYRIMAKRKGYESIRLADKTKQFSDRETQLKRMRHPSKPSAVPIAGLAAPLNRSQAMTKPVIARPR